jgi:hypothetical protein
MLTMKTRLMLENALALTIALTVLGACSGGNDDTGSMSGALGDSGRDGGVALTLYTGCPGSYPDTADLATLCKPGSQYYERGTCGGVHAFKSANSTHQFYCYYDLQSGDLVGTVDWTDVGPTSLPAGLVPTECGQTPWTGIESCETMGLWTF